MVRNIFTRTLFSLLLVNSSATFAADHILGFESSEHIDGAAQVKLHFTANDAGVTDPQFHLANGLILSYSDILTMPDFYEIPGQVISLGKSAQERKTFFLNAFNSLAQANSTAEAEKILAVIRTEQKTVADGMKNGEKPEDIYKRIGSDNNRQWNCITGGGCGKNWYLQPGRYVQLASQDIDHFAEHAWLTYQTGHQLALAEAIAAKTNHDTKKLEHAYALNAFASHFLSDMFAAGHLRIPREELRADVMPGFVGSLLASFMHKEENEFGLHVHNGRGDQWFAYGDDYYFLAGNQQNRILMTETLQLSADEIFQAYQSGVAPTDDGVLQLMPQADETMTQSQQDISPMFYWDEKQHALFRRTDVNNIHDHSWTTNWWGWTTLIILSRSRGLPTESQAQLVLSGYGNEAMQYGLITDKAVLQAAKH